MKGDVASSLGAHVEGSIERLFSAGTLSRTERARLRLHVRECTACRALYDRYAAAESALVEAPSADSGPSQPQLERVEQQLLASGDERRAPRPWLAGGTLAAAAAALLLFVSPGFEPEPVLQARGGAGLTVDSSTRFRVLEVDSGEGSGVRLEELSPGFRARADQQVIFLASCGAAECRVRVELRAAQGRLELIIPETALSAEGEMTRLGAPIRLPAVGSEGTYHLEASFRGADGYRSVRSLAFRVER